MVEDKWHAKAKDSGRGASGSEGNTVKNFIIKVFRPCEDQPHLNMNESCQCFHDDYYDGDACSGGDDDDDDDDDAVVVVMMMMMRWW